MSTYDKLPRLNALDSLKPSSKTTFAAVGYGLQRASNVLGGVTS